MFANAFLPNEDVLGKIGHGLIQYKQLNIMFFPITHETDSPPRILVIATIANSNACPTSSHKQYAEIRHIIKKVDQHVKNNL